jgi:hypothetical protein
VLLRGSGDGDSDGSNDIGDPIQDKNPYSLGEIGNGMIGSQENARLEDEIALLARQTEVEVR